MNENKQQDKDTPKTGHVYDGIEEYDHRIPNWFQAIFVLTVGFGCLYFAYAMSGMGKGSVEEYEAAVSAEARTVAEHVAQGGGPRQATESELQALLKEPGRKEKGGTIYSSRCASCHGALGQGGIGPNLTDRFWLHGRKMTEVVATVSNGVADKGMPPWNAMLTPEEIQSVAVFIRGLEGSNPAGAKGPQGEEVKPD